MPDGTDFIPGGGKYLLRLSSGRYVMDVYLIEVKGATIFVIY
jgi:hypothetical protein